MDDVSPNGPSIRDAPNNEPPHSHPAKAMLFCQTCGHASRLDGDWLVNKEVDGYRVVCPECETVVVAQPTQKLFA
jgi:hypothetical protein